MLSQLFRSLSLPNYEESEKCAKKAIQLDLNGEEGWYCLGNCLVASFFGLSFNLQVRRPGAKRRAEGYSFCSIWGSLSSSHCRFPPALTPVFAPRSSQVLCRGIKAYSKSVSLCPADKPNPDLHYNLAKVLKYLEDFSTAKEHFLLAHNIDQSLGGQQEAKGIEEWFKKVGDMVARKGRVKEKNIVKFIKGLEQVEVPKGGQGEKVHELKDVGELEVSEGRE